jgi:GNAT superfamily N-acetyltransferase
MSAAAQVRQTGARVFGRARAIAQLVAAGEWDVAADEVLSRAATPGNPLFYWDKMQVLVLREPRTKPGRPAPLPERAGVRDIDRLCAQFPDHAARFRQRLLERQECYVYRDGDRVVARHWVIPDRPSFATNAGWTFVPQERPAVWVHDLFIDPAYRLRGYFVGFMDNALSPRDGRRPRVFCEVHFRNQRSLGACLRYGFEVRHEVTAWTCLGARVFVVRDPGGARRVATLFRPTGVQPL